MKIRINKRITLLLLLVFICIISIPSALSMYREKQTKTLKATVTHPNYTVTADANGGSIPATAGWTGTGATATKTVTYGHEYGTLPTPTRAGYTFKGWVNGIESELILPSNYKQLDYIESTRTQYIDTGYIPKTTTKVELDLSFNGDFKNYNTYGGNGGFLGVIDNGARSFTINFGSSSHESTILHSWFNKVFQYDGQGDEALIITDNIRTNRNKMTIENGRITYGTATRTISSKEYDQIDSMYIFGRNNQMSTGTQIPYFTNYNMRVYDMKIYESDVLVRHYVPVIDKTTHKLGLYETVNGVFYSNETLSEFETEYTTSETIVKTSKNHTLKAIWELKESTFLPGEQFNAKIKQLAGNQNATYETEDLNITSIVRSNSLDIMPVDENVVSTSDSNTPIYAWFDSNNGTIYYYTEALNPYMNSNSGNMFRNLKNLNSLDLSEFDTKYTTYMHAMFYNCLKLSSLNISNFDTSNVISMIYMFYNCTALTSVDVSNFNTTSVRSMSHMFRYAGLQSLDISSFDMSNVTNTANMLTNMTSLESLKTPDTYPTDSSVKITLPKLMIDSNGNEYTELDNTSPTETMLYTPATFLQGSQFNIKLKKLANSTLDNITAYTVDTNITVIQRSNTLPSGFVPTSDNTISTSDSYYPIYAWFDNGTIYYYTEALKPYTNENMYQMFYNFDSIETIDLSGISTKKTTNMSAVFTNCNNLHTITLDNNFDSSNVTTMSYMFYNSPITTIDLTKINTSKVTNMSYMFAYTHIANPNLNSFNTSNVEDMSYMFYGNVYSSTMTFGSNFVTSKVSNMEGMFGQCTYLTSLDLSGFNTSNVVNMSKMFYNVSRNTTISLNLNNFNTSKVTNMGQMFFYTQLTSLDISSFDMSLVTDTTSMFTGVNTITELKTPKVYPSEAVIQMPNTLYDPNGNSWSVLDSSAPTETWLHKMVCKRATTLHTETCSQTDDSLYCSGAGYTVGGSKNTSTITYGSLGTNATTLNSGDAFTCDVNGDGTFNETTERFYYVGDYYNTTTKQFETDTGVLIYYNDVSAGVPNNTVISAQPYDSSGENWHGPVTAITQLPTTNQWTNVGLKNNTRAILNRSSTNTTGGGTLPSDFSYSGYSARLLTVQEINHSLNRPLTDYQYRLDEIAPYYFENTLYSSASLKMRTWLETAEVNSVSADTLMVNQYTEYVNGIYYGAVNSSNYGVRPAIEVNKNFLNKKVNAYLITYDTNGGSENTTQTVTVGDSLDSLSVPTKEGYTFAGWYTEASGGTQITTATVPTATTTYYAHWTPIDYNITYDLDGGTVTTNNPSTYNADSNAITLNNPTRNGYTFAGWSGGKNKFTGLTKGKYINPETGKIEDKENTASSDYIPIDFNNSSEYIISGLNNQLWSFAAYYNENKEFKGRTSGGAKSKIVLSNDYPVQTEALGDVKYVRITQYVSNSNQTIDDVDNLEIQLEEGSTATSYEPYVSKTLTIPSGSTGDRKYKANWTANSYTVKYNGNGNTGGSTANSSHTYDQEKALTTNGFTKTGYTFRGWSTSSTDTNLVYDNSEYSKDATLASIYINIVQYNIDAPFEEGEVYQLDFEAKGTGVLSTYFYGSGDYLKVANVINSDGYSGTNPDGYNPVNLTNDYKHYSIRFTLGSSGDGNQVKYVLFRVFKENIGYVKNIRFNKVSSSSTAYVDGQIVKNLTATNEATVNLYALWDPTDYEITYDLQGGTLSTTNPATYNIETDTFTLNNPTLTGQTFIGWTGSNGNTPEVNVTIPVGSYGDKAYVAHFSPIYDPETRIRSLNTIGTSIADDDPDSNLRFIGSNPNNYVSFNGQKWRIIGVFDGKLKIIQEPIGSYSWDTSRNTVNNGYGVNQWGVSGTYTGADLMKLLNPGYSTNTDLKCNTTVTITDGVANCGDNTDSNYTTGLVNNSLYWNASSGYCYNYGNYKTTSCDFTTTGLQSDTTRNMIDNATWYLGGNLASDNIWDGRMTASYLYNIERSNNTGKQCSGGDYCNDDVTRTTTWQGKVGLLYPSDYIYATGGGSTYNRNTCLTVHAGYVSDNSVSNWNNTYTDCKNNDWLLPSSWTWSLSPRAYSSYSISVFNVNATGIVHYAHAMNAGSVRPVVYLKSSIKFTTGDGSFNSPFNLIDTE